MDLYQKAVDLMAQVASIQEENDKLAQQVRDLRAEADQLREARKISDQLVARGNAYYRSSTTAEKLAHSASAAST